MAEKRFNSFFPEYLNKGSKGPAVTMLQSWLRLLGYAQVNVTGEYKEKTAEAVSDLQAKMGVEVDGNFGPKTREAFFERYHVDVNAIPASAMAGKTKGLGPEAPVTVGVGVGETYFDETH